MGSGASAFSLFFAAGFAAACGAAGFAGGAPAFGAGGAGVLPSTGSAIIPVINLSKEIISRDKCYVENDPFYILRPLCVKANSHFGAIN
jgi:hypothetical protein